MAYTPCNKNLAANIQEDCSKPFVAGFIGEGVLIDLGVVTPEVAIDNANPRKFTSITIGESDHVCVVDNVWRDPFNGSSRTLDAETGRARYTNTLSLRVPGRSADISKDVVEPLASSYFLGIFPTVDKKFLVYGWYGKFQASEQTQNESDNGGDFANTLSETSPYAVCELWDTDYNTTKAIYDALKSKAF